MQLASRIAHFGVLGSVNAGDLEEVYQAWDTRPQREQGREKTLHHERRVAS